MRKQQLLSCPTLSTARLPLAALHLSGGCATRPHNAQLHQLPPRCGMLSARSLAAGRPLWQQAAFYCTLCCLALAETALVGRRTSIVYVLPVPVCPYLRKMAGLSETLFQLRSTSVLRQGIGASEHAQRAKGRNGVRARKDGAVEALKHLFHDWCDCLHVQLLLARLRRKHLNQRHAVS